jgi:hypothetical protein
MEGRHSNSSTITTQEQWLYLVHRFHFFTVASSTCTSPKKKLLTRFERVAGTLTSRLVVTLVFRGFVAALIVGKLVVTLER